MGTKPAIPPPPPPTPFFFDKAFVLSKTIHSSQDPVHAGVARYARNGACLVCVIPTT